MANDDNTTDRHDESDRAQFHDDPHNIEGTPFEASACTDCGRYVVKVPGYPRPLCTDCARTQAGITSTDTITVTTTPTGYTYWYLSTPPPEKLSDVMWGCLYCYQRGNADNPTHATALHAIHIAHACPGAPGLSRNEIALRLARRKPLEALYPETTPPWTPHTSSTPADSAKTKADPHNDNSPSPPTV